MRYSPLVMHWCTPNTVVFIVDKVTIIVHAPPIIGAVIEAQRVERGGEY